MKLTSRKGFTLIELLVVIAIIGILAGIVLVSLGGARTRAKDTRIISDLSQLRTEAEILYSSDGSYVNVDATKGEIKKLSDDITLQGSSLTIETNSSALTTKCDGTAGTAPANGCYCAYAKLNAPAAETWYCVDGPGMTAKSYTGTAPTCTSTDFTCD